MIPPELEATILRLYHAEKWRVGTIAQQMRVHRDAVLRVLHQNGLPRVQRSRKSALDSYIPFIQDTWKKYPKLPASRLYAMCHERGHRGSPDHFRHFVAPYRPRPRAEAYLRLRTLPGEQGQIDWAHFGKVTIGRAERQLVAFVAVLSYSRRIFLRYFLGMQTENFLRGHVAAFESWQGCPRILLYDNLKSAVLERKGDAIRFNPLLTDFSRHYRYEPRPVALARGNEKGRVERAISYVRRSFFMARRYRDVADLNRQAEAWCDGPAMERKWPEDDRITVRQAFEKERPLLLSLPADSFPTDERREARVGKTPYVRFDGNDYSVPHKHVRQTLVVLASLEKVRIFRGSEVVANHPRSFDRHQQIEDPAHIEGLVDEKRKARAHRGLDRLARAAPSSADLFCRLAERGVNLGNRTVRLLRLLEEYGGERLERAIAVALERDAPHVASVRQILEQERLAAGKAPSIPVRLPDDPRVRELTVRPHPLSSYDALVGESSNEEEDHDDEETR